VRTEVKNKPNGRRELPCSALGIPSKVTAGSVRLDCNWQWGYFQSPHFGPFSGLFSEEKHALSTMMPRASNAGSTKSDEKNRCVGVSGWQPPREGCQPPQLHFKQEHEGGADPVWWGRWDLNPRPRGLPGCMEPPKPRSVDQVSPPPQDARQRLAHDPVAR
jgi:hypothetical protein